MKYKDRLTSRIDVENKRVYVSKHDHLAVLNQLGLYEDLGYSPYELSEILINTEMSKPRNAWDLDALEKWQRIKEYIEIYDVC